MNIERMKREAKKAVRAGGITHTQALDQIAAKNGYHNWAALMKAQQQNTQSTKPVVYIAPRPKDYPVRDDEAIKRFT